MGGGLLQLVAHGIENTFLTENPTITYFKTVYKRHSVFSLEPIPQLFNVKPNFGERVTCTISKSGDLISKMYVVVDIPSVVIRQSNVTAQWVECLGFSLIKTVELEIGGTIIDRQTGDWLYIMNRYARNNKEAGLNAMIGNIPKLTLPSSSLDAYRLYIPLAFWFCNHVNLALPMAALEHSEVKVNVEFNPIESLLNVGPTHYITLKENVVNFQNGEFLQQGTKIGRYAYFDATTQRLYYTNLLNGKPFTAGDIKGSTSSYVATATAAEQVSLTKSNIFENIINVTITNAFMLVDFIYLETVERLKIARSDHEFLIPYVQYDNDKILTNNFNKVKIGYSLPVKEIFVRAQVDSISLSMFRDPYNYCTDVHRKNNVISSMKIIFNGIVRENISDSYLFTSIQPYEKHKGRSVPGVFCYSFALNPFDSQPSGSVNLTQVDDFVLEVGVDTSVGYTNPARLAVYAITYNVVQITNGLAKLLF